MSKITEHTGFAIAIAWPETYCKQPGYWYDGLMHLLGISNNYYYKVGHAALVLISDTSDECHYFDFGRYHAPFQHGRVRSKTTDNGLKIHVRAKRSANNRQIENFSEIITALQHNPECHGEGTIYASYCSINFEKAYQKAMGLQDKSPVPYGPFRYNGSNCSRFVADCILAGKPNAAFRYKMKYCTPFTPTPLTNVKALGVKISIPKLLSTPAFCPSLPSDFQLLKTTLSEPPKPFHLSKNAQWLSGEGSGSWFDMELTDDNYLIRRYSPEGKLECSGIFQISQNTPFEEDKPYSFDHISHCNEVKIKQGKYIHVFLRKQLHPEQSILEQTNIKTQ